MSGPDERVAAVDQAYRDHAAELYRVAFGILRDVDAAADATQVAFARAFERWDQYDPRRPLLAWLHGIVVHAALDATRRARVRRVLVSPTAPQISAAGIAGDDATARVADRAVLDAGLAALAPRDRAVLVLHHVYGYDYAEIGRLIGTSGGNVGSILTRSHARLRAHLAALDVPSSSDPLPATPGSTANAEVHR